MENTNPIISVIINCFNGERFLREAIDSIYAQSNEDWEIIFWDNCSNDKSVEIASSYDSRIKIFTSDQTINLGAARNHALDKANGKYLAFLDCDDIFNSNMFEEQLKLFQNSEFTLGFVYGRCEFFVSDSNIKRKIGFSHEGEILKSGDIFSDLCKNNFIPWPSTLVDREKLINCGGFPDHFKNSEDYWIFLKLSKKYLVGANKLVVSRARGHIGNLAHSQYSLAAREDIEIISEYLPDLSAKIGLKYHGVSLFIAYIKERDYKNALKTIIKYGGWRLLIHRIIRKAISPIFSINLNLTIYD